MDSRTQHCTIDPDLCPVIQYGNQVQKILHNVPNVNSSTTVNTIALNGKAGLITNTYILQILRTTSCSSFGGKATFRLDSLEIGN